ncbi:hypothetical protein K1719_033529 [Acacia pycnantha]|nr:hypothetical protein K1719_033529 [Acacia pycnantha]
MSRAFVGMCFERNLVRKEDLRIRWRIRTKKQSTVCLSSPPLSQFSNAAKEASGGSGYGEEEEHIGDSEEKC